MFTLAVCIIALALLPVAIPIAIELICLPFIILGAIYNMIFGG